MGNIPDDNKFHFMNINEVVIAETKENMIEDTNEKVRKSSFNLQLLIDYTSKLLLISSDFCQCFKL